MTCGLCGSRDATVQRVEGRRGRQVSRCSGCVDQSTTLDEAEAYRFGLFQKASIDDDETFADRVYAPAPMDGDE